MQEDTGIMAVMVHVTNLKVLNDYVADEAISFTLVSNTPRGPPSAR